MAGVVLKAKTVEQIVKKLASEEQEELSRQ